MYSFYLVIFFGVSLLTQHIQAVESGKQIKQELGPLIKQALPPIGNTLYSMYNKNMDTMNRYHRKLRTLDRQLKHLNEHTFKRQRPQLRPSGREQARKERKEIGQLRGKHLKSWQKASDAAGSQHLANQFIHSLNPKDVTPTKNPRQHVLQLVGKWAGKEWIARHEKVQAHDRQWTAVHEKSLALMQAEEGKKVDGGHVDNLLEDLSYHSSEMEHHQMGAFDALYVNHVLGLTVKGVKQAPVPDRGIVKEAAEWSKTPRPFWRWYWNKPRPVRATKGP
ncbi:hypothetical protein MMC10_004680 [Thelotrema lepadinum]|nr:hypothetical protein [Thelotrema lepadinum]